MSKYFGADDLAAVAGQVSRHFGARFGVENLVSYGVTTIVKPGARTDAGHLVSATDLMNALGGSYDVHPMAVAYAGDGADGDEDDASFERGIAQDLDEAEADTDAAPEEMFGADSFFDDSTPASMSPYAVRMRERYVRISKRFGRYASRAVAFNRRIARALAAKVFRRVTRLWDKMGSKGIPRFGLMSPEALKARIYAAAKQLQASTSAVTPGPGLMPARRLNVPLAYDQGALERSVGLNATGQLLSQQISSSAFGASSGLSADARAETLGYLWGPVEHNYFGLVGEAFEVLAPEDEDAFDPEVDAEIEAEANARAEMESVDNAPTEKDDLDAEIDAELSAGMDDDDGEDEAGNTGEDLDGLEAEIDADLESDQDGEADDEIDAELSEGDDDDDLDAEIERELQSDAPEKAPARSSAVKSAAQDVAKDVDVVISEVKSIVAVPVSDEHASKLSQVRTALNEKLVKAQAEGQGPVETLVKAGTASAEKVKAIAEKVKKVDEALQNAAPNGSINYGALVPAPAGAKEKIVVIAIKKNMDGSIDPDRKAIAQRASSMGLPSEGHLAEVFGMDMLSQGYSPAAAYYALDQSTEPSDFMGVDSGEYVEGPPDATLDEMLTRTGPYATVIKAFQAAVKAKKANPTDQTTDLALRGSFDALKSFWMKSGKRKNNKDDRFTSDWAKKERWPYWRIVIREILKREGVSEPAYFGGGYAMGATPPGPATLDEMLTRKGPYAQVVQAVMVAAESKKANPADAARGLALKGAVTALNDFWKTKGLSGGKPSKAAVKFRWPEAKSILEQIKAKTGVAEVVSGSAARLGSMNVSQAVAVFGAYINGFNAEPMVEDTFGDTKAAKVKKVERYKLRVSNFERAKAAGDQMKAGEILGRMKKLWAQLSEKQRKNLKSPESYVVPGVEIAQTVVPEAAAAESQVQATSAAIKVATKKSEQAEAESLGSYGADVDDEIDELLNDDLDEGSFGGRSDYRKYNRNVEQFIRRLSWTNQAARDWDEIMEQWREMSGGERKLAKSPEQVLLMAIKKDKASTAMATGRSLKSLNDLVKKSKAASASSASSTASAAEEMGAEADEVESEIDELLREEGIEESDDADLEEGDRGEDFMVEDAMRRADVMGYGGSRAVFPRGPAAPFSPPRMAGREVY